MIARRLLLLVVLATACKEREGGSAATTEEGFVKEELVKLKAALAERSDTHVTVECTVVTTSLKRLHGAIADEISQLCFVEAPKLLLELAIAEERKSRAEHPDLPWGCMQLFAPDAIATTIAHPSKDPALQKLVDEYTQLCPEAVDKARAKARTH